MPSGLAKDVRKILDHVEDRGFTVRRGSKHFRIVNRDGSGVLASVSTTPSDHRTLDNLVSQLRKVGVLDIDPRKEGQVATPRDESLSPDQAALRERLLTVLQIIPPGEFSLHATELAVKRAAEDPNGVRAFKTSGDRRQKAAQWHLTQLVRHGRPIVGWAAANLEAAMNDVMAMPEPEPQPEPEPEQLEEVATSTQTPLEAATAAKNRLRALDSGLIGRVNEIARAVESGLNIGRNETLKPRRWGYGLWPLLGRLVLETANRHGVDPQFSGKKSKRPRAPENVVGYRLRSLANGEHTYAKTKRLAQQFVEDWDAGYRIRPDHLAGFRLLDPTHTIPAELRSTRSTRYAPDAVIEKQVPEQLEQVEPELEDTTPELGDVIELVQPKYQAELVQPGATTEVKHVYFPAAWEDGQMPLHLEMLQGAMELALGVDPRINRIVETARRVMLAELGSH